MIACSWRLHVCLVGAGTSIPELPISFLEHAQYDRVLMHSKRMADLNWWCTQLAGAPLDPLLTTDYPRSGRPNIGQNQGDIVKVCTRPLLLSHQQADEASQKLHFSLVPSLSLVGGADAWLIAVGRQVLAVLRVLP